MYQAFFVHFRPDLIRSIALGIAMLACIQVAAAQSSHYITLHDALVEFQNIWGIDLAYNATLVENKWTAWSEPEKQNAEEDLTLLLKGTGLVAYRLPSGTYGLEAAENRLGLITGRVADAATRQPLADASITLIGTPYGTSTDEEGRFRLENVKAGDVQLSVSFVGYETQRTPLLLVPGGHLDLESRLLPDQFELSPIEIQGREMAFAPQLITMDRLEGEEVVQPDGIGTTDVVRNIRNIPGVSMDEKSASIHIQGGHEGDHQFLLDGNPVYDPTHSFGVASKFNAYALERIVVHKAGFPASQGSYNSGLVRAEHAILDTTGTRADMSIDPISLNARINLHTGPARSIRSSLMLAYRTSVWNGWWSGTRSNSVDKLLLDWNEPDIFLHRASLYPMKKLRPDLYQDFADRLSQIPPPAVPEIYFSDFHASGQAYFQNMLVRASYYRGDNKLRGRHLIARVLENDPTIPRPDTYDWLNENGQVSGSLPISSRAVLTTKVRGSYYRLSHKYSGLDRDDARVITFVDRLFINLTPAEDGNKIKETGLQQTLDLVHDAGSLAISWEYLRSDHRFVVQDIFPQGIRHIRKSSSLMWFAEQVLSPAPGFTVTAGARMTYLQSRKVIYVEPRFSVDMKLRTGSGNAFVSRLAGGVYHQFLNQFVVSTISPSTLIPSTRIWLPVDESLPPPLSYHAAADAGIEFNNHWSLRLEGYFKDQPRVFRIDYPRLWQPDDQSTADAPAKVLTSQSDFVALAKGIAYGTAGILERKTARLNLHLRYERSIAKREFAFRGGDIRMEPVPWSEPHRLHFNTGVRLARRLQATARWRSVWGRVWGFRQAYYNYLATDTDQGLTFGGVDFRLPTSDQHRLNGLQQLDLGVSYSPVFGQVVLQLRADLLNAFDRKNEAALFLKEKVPGSSQPDGQEESDLLIERQHLIGRTLSVSIRLRW